MVPPQTFSGDFLKRFKTGTIQSTCNHLLLLPRTFTERNPLAFWKYCSVKNEFNESKIDLSILDSSFTKKKFPKRFSKRQPFGYVCKYSLEIPLKEINLHWSLVN